MRAVRGSFWGLLLLISAIAASAQDIDLSGNVGWRRGHARFLRVYAGRVENTTDAASGRLFLTIRATTNSPSGGEFRDAPVIGVVPLGHLRAHRALVRINRVAAYLPPPAGLYFTSMTLEEETADGYVIHDYVDFEGLVNIGGVGSGAAPGNGFNGDVFFEGQVSWQSESGMALIQADEVVNGRDTRTGALMLRLWASPEPYAGGQPSGQILGRAVLTRLQPGYEHRDFARTVRFRPPAPEGYFYTFMTLEEQVRGRWVVRDVVAFPNAVLF